MDRIEKFIKKLKKLEDISKVKFAILYGSTIERYSTKDSDLDICVYYDTNDKKKMFDFRLKLLVELCDDKYDIQIFQTLPLYIKMEIIKGKVIYTKDKKFIYKTALETLREYELFEPHLHQYIYKGIL